MFRNAPHKKSMLLVSVSVSACWPRMSNWTSQREGSWYRENSGSFTCPVYSTDTWDLGLKSHTKVILVRGGSNLPPLGYLSSVSPLDNGLLVQTRVHKKVPVGWRYKHRFCCFWRIGYIWVYTGFTKHQRFACWVISNMPFFFLKFTRRSMQNIVFHPNFADKHVTFHRPVYICLIWVSNNLDPRWGPMFSGASSGFKLFAKAIKGLQNLHLVDKGYQLMC